MHGVKAFLLPNICTGVCRTEKSDFQLRHFCPQGTTWLPLEEFSLNFIFEYFSKISRKIQVSLKSDEIPGSLHEDILLLVIIPRLILLKMRNVSDNNCSVIQNTYFIYCKSKAVPLQAWSDPEGSRKLRFPHFMTTAQDDGKVVSLTHRSPLLPEIQLILISVRDGVDSRAIVRPEGFCNRKIPMTPSGFEPATCRFVT
jgi:hypothetical protein